jgi:hypothetical protein
MEYSLELLTREHRNFIQQSGYTFELLQQEEHSGGFKAKVLENGDQVIIFIRDINNILTVSEVIILLDAYKRLLNDEVFNKPIILNDNKYVITSLNDVESDISTLILYGLYNDRSVTFTLRVEDVNYFDFFSTFLKSLSIAQIDDPEEQNAYIRRLMI